MNSSVSLTACTTLQQVQFLLLLPGILRSIRFGTRGLRPQEREEACQEVTVQAFLGFLRLCQRGLPEKGFASSLARFALKRYRSGRRVSSTSSSLVLSAENAARQSLGTSERRRVRRRDAGHAWGNWQDSLPVDCRTPVADQVCFRLDFDAWYASLAPVKRTVIDQLSLGYSPAEVAETLNVTCARISQIRKELQRSWGKFVDEAPTERFCFASNRGEEA